MSFAVPKTEFLLLIDSFTIAITGDVCLCAEMGQADKYTRHCNGHPLIHEKPRFNVESLGMQLVCANTPDVTIFCDET